MDRRELRRKLGHSTRGSAALWAWLTRSYLGDTIEHYLGGSSPEEDLIEGEMPQWRAIEILANLGKANPTVDELRMMMRDLILVPENLDWIGIMAVRDIVLGIAMQSEDLYFKTDVLNCAEFKRLKPRYREHLEEVREHLEEVPNDTREEYKRHY
jgi:hypothetical protein